MEKARPLWKKLSSVIAVRRSIAYLRSRGGLSISYEMGETLKAVAAVTSAKWGRFHEPGKLSTRGRAAFRVVQLAGPMDAIPERGEALRQSHHADRAGARHHHTSIPCDFFLGIGALAA